jgi:hypothetical protein
MSVEWFERVNESPWMGSICEVGVGLPFQNAFVSIPGASSTVLFTHCPYSKAFQPSDVPRSVTHEMAARYAWTDIEKIYANKDVQDESIFALAVTAAHKTEGQRGMSHGWVTLACKRDERDVARGYSFHFRLSKKLDRIEAGEFLNKNIQWFISKVLLNEWETWGEAINARPKFWQCSIDIIRAPDISIEEHLLLASHDVPLVYHHDEFKRPVDYFRSHAKLLGGAFNPPTARHFDLGRSALFCLDFENPRKETITEKDMAHRVRMLNTEGVPVLINRGRKYIVDINDVVIRYGMREPTFIIGVDTFNAVCNEKFIPTPDFLEPLYGENGTKFEVVRRTGYDIVDNEWSRLLNFEVVTIDGDEVSSTRVRNGEFNLTTRWIRKYIEDNDLY